MKRRTPTIRTGRTGFDAIRISWLFITGGEPEQGRHPKLQLRTPRGGTGPSRHRGKCVHSEVGVKGDGACQLHLRTETIGQNGCGHCQPLGIWEYVTPSKRGSLILSLGSWLELPLVPASLCLLVFPPQPRGPADPMQWTEGCRGRKLSQPGAGLGDVLTWNRNSTPALILAPLRPQLHFFYGQTGTRDLGNSGNQFHANEPHLLPQRSLRKFFFLEYRKSPLSTAPGGDKDPHFHR